MTLDDSKTEFQAELERRKQGVKVHMELIEKWFPIPEYFKNLDAAKLKRG